MHRYQLTVYSANRNFYHADLSNAKQLLVGILIAISIITRMPLNAQKTSNALPLCFPGQRRNVSPVGSCSRFTTNAHMPLKCIKVILYPLSLLSKKRGSLCGSQIYSVVLNIIIFVMKQTCGRGI